MEIFLEKEGNINKHGFFCEIKSHTEQIIIKNASDSRYAKGWNNYAPFESTDGKNWHRTKPGSYNGKEFIFEINKNSKYACWFPNYPQNKMDKISKLCLNSEENMFIIGNLALPKIVLLSAQHPGETMGLYFLEGIIKAIHQENDILNHFCFVVFPTVNLSGIKAHNHRLTPDGIDLNRAWQTDCPELAHIKQEIAALKNIYALVDIHGDEVSKTDYVIFNKNFTHTLLATGLQSNNFKLLKQQSRFKKFLKNLIRNKKWIIDKRNTARDYFENQGIRAITLELSAHQNTPESCIKKGMHLIRQLNKD